MIITMHFNRLNTLLWLLFPVTVLCRVGLLSPHLCLPHSEGIISVSHRSSHHRHAAAIWWVMMWLILKRSPSQNTFSNCRVIWPSFQHPMMYVSSGYCFFTLVSRTRSGVASVQTSNLGLFSFLAIPYYWLKTQNMGLFIILTFNHPCG